MAKQVKPKTTKKKLNEGRTATKPKTTKQTKPKK